MLATKSARYAAVLELIKNKSDLTLKNKNKLTVIDIASQELQKKKEIH